MDLIDWLEAKEAELGLAHNHSAFARVLGISPHLWSMYRSRERGVTLYLGKKARKAFPEHRALICELAFDDDMAS